MCSTCGNLVHGLVTSMPAVVLYAQPGNDPTYGGCISNGFYATLYNNCTQLLNTFFISLQSVILEFYTICTALIIRTMNDIDLKFL